MGDIQLTIERLRIYLYYLRQDPACNPHVAAYVAGKIHDLELSSQNTNAHRRNSTSSGEQAGST